MTNQIPNRESDFDLPLYPDYWINCWKIVGKESFDLVFRIELKDGNEVVYVERISTAPDKFPDKFFEAKKKEVKDQILYALVKHCVVKSEKLADQ